MGVGHIDLRIPDRIPAILEFESNRDLQTVLTFFSILFLEANIKTRIVSKEVHFPSEPAISEEAKSIIRGLCTLDRSKRLGNLSGRAQDVKGHPFFHGVNWEDVYYRRSRGPIIPPIRYPGDAQCFDFYPDEKEGRERYTEDLEKKWDSHFKDF